MNLPLANTQVLVTGGAVRIGKAISLAFAAAGASVRVHYNRSQTEAEALCKELPASDAVQLDLTQAADESLLGMLQDIDILVNNASVYFTAGTFKETEQKSIDTNHLAVNYEVPVRLMELFAAAERPGCIINLLDAAVLKPDVVHDSYSQSKFLLFLATRVKAIELAPEVRVNGVAPGSILPPFWLPDSLMEKSIAEMPLQKAPAVEDVAIACVFLASNHGITGEVIRVDGGRHLV